MKRFLAVVITGLVTSCSGGGGAESPSGPSGSAAPPTLDGTYNGIAVADRTGSVSFLLTATVSGGNITGTLGSPDGRGQVALSGSVSAAGDVTMTAIDDCGSARYTLTGSLTRDSSGAGRLAGSWSQPSVAGCPGASGTFTMMRGAIGTPTSGFPNGTWVGTLSRPSGESIALTWVATRGPAPNAMSSGSFDGPLTMTYGGVTVTARLYGFLAGSDSAVMTRYRFNFQIEMVRGASASVPACSFVSADNGAITEQLRDASTTISTPAFLMHYSNCQGFTEPVVVCGTPPCASNTPPETTRMVLTKQ